MGLRFRARFPPPMELKYGVSNPPFDTSLKYRKSFSRERYMSHSEMLYTLFNSRRYRHLELRFSNVAVPHAALQYANHFASSLQKEKLGD